MSNIDQEALLQKVPNSFRLLGKMNDYELKVKLTNICFKKHMIGQEFEKQLFDKCYKKVLMMEQYLDNELELYLHDKIMPYIY